MRISRSLIGIIAAILVAAIPLASPAQVAIGVGVNIGVAPPPLPYYDMPVAPAPNYQWEPGYWAYGAYGYYWVPGTWVAAPAVGLYWTPGYWGWGGAGYSWNAGYWGPSVGFYGGINYGFGYFGTGFVGGVWSRGVFRYNTAVVRVNTRYIHNTYINRTVIRVNRSRVAYNGGRGGIVARPTAAQRAAYARRRFGLTPAQRMHEQIARQDRNMYDRYNHGRPAVLAASRPFSASNRPAHFTMIHNTTVHNNIHNTTVHKNVHNTTVRNNVHNTTVHRATVTHPAAAHPARPAYHPPSSTYRSHSTYHSSGTYHSTYHSSGAYHPAARPAYHPQAASHPGAGHPGRAPAGGHPPSGGGHPPSGGGGNGGDHHPPHA